MSDRAKPVRSMTGFANVRRATPNGEIGINVKSLNHRGLDLHLHLPPSLEQVESQVRELIKQRLARGYVQVSVSLAATRTESLGRYNRALLESYLAAFREAAQTYELPDQPDLNAAFRIPGMFGETSPEEADAELEAPFLDAFAEALDELNAFREREGGQTVEVMQTSRARISDCAGRMEAIRATATPAFQARLTERLSDLLRGTAVEPQRLAQEAALLADRSDIGEEVARLKIHTAQLDEILSAGGEIGKKLDFLLQEMNREANTILSKTSGVGELGLTIADLALMAKADIEKIREQALNLE
jgi:uncharacterized protein (TIGR00255 family)